MTRPVKPAASLVGLCAVTALSLSGCAVGPDFEPPAAPPVAAYVAGANATPGVTRAGAAPNEAWWARFGSPKLAGLIDDALANNQDLAAAAAGARAAQALAAAQRASFFPTIGAGFDAARFGNPGRTLDSPLVSGANVYALQTAQLTVSYAPDVFGGVRRAVESQDASALALDHQRDALALTVAGNLALAAVQEASLRAQIVVTRRLIGLQGGLLDVIRRQNSAGQIALPDVAAQETAIAQARLLLPALERQLDQQRHIIATLTGRYPAERLPATFDLASFRAAAVPLTLPADLVRQRPDIRAAEANLRAANANIGVAIAARLPQITLSGQTGSSAAALGKLFSPGTAAWSLAGGLVQPLFDAGALANRQVAAEELHAQALAQYRSTVLLAFQNVADALRGLQSDARAIAAARAAEASAARNIDLIRKQIDQGQVSLPNLISAQQAYLQTSLARVQAEAQRLSDMIALYTALGGGHWSRPPLVTVATPVETAAAVNARF